MNILIADSGSTKTDWCLTNGTNHYRFETAGINPFLQSTKEITSQIQNIFDNHPIDEVFFYGAGCIGKKAIERVSLAIENATGVHRIEIHDDLTGAARSLCGHKAGIACILGTGSNSCQYDGEKIVRHTPPLGYVLGDEGSGNALGKRLLSDFLKGQMPRQISKDFKERFGITQENVLEAVYRRPFPNRYMASFAIFLNMHENEDYTQYILKENFSNFFKRNILQYDPELPVHFTGSVAWHFKKILIETAIAHHFKPGRVVKNPIDGLISYHLQNSIG